MLISFPSLIEFNKSVCNELTIIPLIVDILTSSDNRFQNMCYAIYYKN